MKKILLIVGIGMIALGIISSGIRLEIVNPGLVDDTMVTQISPTRVWGSSPDIRVYKVGGDVMYTYLKHNVNLGGNIEVNWATLSFFATYYNGETFKVHQVTENWDEGTMNWQNKADYDPIAIASYGSDWLSNPIHITITDLVKKWVSGEPNYGLALIPEEGCSLALLSKENTTVGGAVLAIEYNYLGNEEVVEIDNDGITTEDTSTDKEVRSNAVTEGTKDTEISLLGWILIIAGVILTLYAAVTED
jgi:hypothetical protein